jgi:peptidoglycan/xylan/chitin deacetylase (PgdA/CDA1 family)
MTATFILSLDCEGKWGVADHLDATHRETLSDARLKRAYRSIVELLDRYEIPATFAFVGTFTWSRETAQLDALREFASLAPYYFDRALAEIPSGEGWFGEWAVDMLPTEHEIALHGATHLPWGGLDERIARAELQLLPTMPRVAGAETYVFPRNQVNHTHLLGDAGIKGWRAARKLPRLRSLLSEFNLFSAPDRPTAPEIPAGYFVNWRSGLRRLVPPAVSRLRARNMLALAARTGGVVHYWTHPENIASAPGTLDVLDGILAEVARSRNAGTTRVLTQRDYCRELPG